MELLRREPLLGSNKVIIGSPTEELVLETLGKLYIKQQNSFIDVIECLENLNSSDSDSTYESKVEFTLNIAAEDPTVYKDGIFMFDVSSLRLYLVYKNKFRFITDLKANSESDVFVKRDGSTDMSGTLVIKTTDVPLQVTSKKLVKNLNAELFDSNTTDAFAMKEKNETIKGDYTFNGASEFNGTVKFNNKTTFNRIATFNRESVFNDNSTFNRNIIANGNIRQATGDLITDGSMGSSSFASGFTGHGWRLDANTNTLTIDNLVVRGILSVFELVVNKISATNGSLWVTDSFKVGEVKPVTEVEVEDLGSLDNFFSEPQYEKYYKNDTAKTTEEELTNDEADEVTEEEGSEETTKEIKSSSFVIFYENSVSVDDPSYDADDMNRHIINADTQASYSDLNTIYAYNRNGLNLTAFPYYVYNNFYRINTSSEITGGVEGNVLSGELLEYPLYTPTENGINYKNKLLNSVYTFAPVKVPYVDGQTPNDNVKTASSISQDATVSYVCSTLVRSYLYFLYFCNNPIFVLYPDDDTDYPNFKIGDLLKCQKFTGKSTKQYNAVVLNTIEDFIVIQLGTGPLDYYTEYDYDAEGNMTNSVSERLVDDLGNYITKFIPEKGDALVKIGNLFNADRTGSLFLTSSELYSPYIDTMYGVCRPDYNVAYWEPEYKTAVIPINGVNKTVYITDGDDPTATGTTGGYYDPEEGEDFFYNFTPNPTYNLYNTTTLNNVEYIICKLNNYTKARFGRLDGIYNECFGNHQPHGYGLYGENVFLTGEFYLSNGKSVVSFGDDIRLVSASTQLALEQVNQNLNGFSLNILNVVSEMNLLRTSTKNIIKNASTLTESNLTDYWNLVGCDTTTYQASDVGYEGLETIQLGNYYVKSAVFRAMDASLLNTQITILDGTFNLTPSTQYVLSLYVKADLSTEDPDLRDIIFLGASLQSHTITNGINRYYYTFTTTSSLDTYIATRLRVLYQVYDDTYGYQGSIPIQIYGTQLEQGSTPTAFEDLGQSATLMTAEEKAKQTADAVSLDTLARAAQVAAETATETLNSEFDDMLLDNTSAFAHAYSTAAKTPDGGAAFAASYALAAGRAGLQLTGVSYNSSTGVQVANSSKIGLIADAIDIKNYIYWDSAEEEYVERIPDNDLGGYLQKIYYTTVSPLPNLNIWNLTANDIHVGWILTYEIPSKTTAVPFPVNVTILDELGESKILSWQYYYENSLGYTIFANDTTGNYPYKPGSAISFLNASAVNFILYTLSTALFENGKIKAHYIDVDYLKTLIIDVEELKADLLLAGIIDADNITVKNVVAAPLAYTYNSGKLVFEDGTDVPEEYAYVGSSAGMPSILIANSVFIENNDYYMYEYSMYLTEYNYELRCSYPSGPYINGMDGISGWQAGYYTKYTDFSPFKGYLSTKADLKQGQLLVSSDLQNIDYSYNGYYIFGYTSDNDLRVSEVRRKKIVLIPTKDVIDKEKVPHVFISGGSGKLEALEATIKNLKGTNITYNVSIPSGWLYNHTAIADLNLETAWTLDSGGDYNPTYPLKNFYMLSADYGTEYVLPNTYSTQIGKEITFISNKFTSNYVRIKGMFVISVLLCQGHTYDAGSTTISPLGNLNFLNYRLIDGVGNSNNKITSGIVVIELRGGASIKVVALSSGWYLIGSSGVLIIRQGTYAWAYLNGVAWAI